MLHIGGRKRCRGPGFPWRRGRAWARVKALPTDSQSQGAGAPGARGRGQAAPAGEERTAAGDQPCCLQPQQPRAPALLEPVPSPASGWPQVAGWQPAGPVAPWLSGTSRSSSGALPTSQHPECLLPAQLPVLVGQNDHLSQGRVPGKNFDIS